MTEVLGTNGLLKFLDLIIIMKRSARRTKVFSNNINAKKLHIKALNVMLMLFFTFYNWFRFHKGINGIPASGGGLI
ncbi:MAG: hypothetical protein ACP5FU_03090 [Nitrososphaeria archaeon]